MQKHSTNFQAPRCGVYKRNTALNYIFGAKVECVSEVQFQTRKSLIILSEMSENVAL